jgi:O-succinylbenzoate synthase
MNNAVSLPAPAAATWRVFRYTLSVDPPLPVPGGMVDKRSGWLLHARFPDGREGWGDVAPLDGFSPDSMSEAARALQVWAADPCTTALLPASLRCGRDEALADALERPPPTPVPLARLIAGPDPATWLAAAEQAAVDGYRAVKIKVGRGCPENEAAAVQAIGRALPAAVAVRCDANRAWSRDQALAFLRGVDVERIALFEEPLARGAELPDLIRQTGCRVALDEQLMGRTPDDLDRFGPIAGLILKPMALGGWAVCQSWVEAARQRGLAVVISALHESGVGIRAWMHRWAELPAAQQEPAGLDTITSLVEDVHLPRLVVRDGRLIDPAPDRRAYHLNEACVKEGL